MELYFNELSLTDSPLGYMDYKEIARAYSVLRNNGIKSCRINGDYFKQILMGCNSFQNSRDLSDLMRSFFHAPYESDDVNRREEQYYIHSWSFGQNKSFGLAVAYIMESASFSLRHPEFCREIVDLLCDDYYVAVRNVFDEQSARSFCDYLESRKPVVLLECKTNPKDKRCHLSDDHGNDILRDFSKRILNSPYVIEVTNSLPYNPGNRSFIHNAYSDGLIEIVLPWTDQGLGFVIKTTGRNQRETEEIAKVLKSKYCKR